MTARELYDKLISAKRAFDFFGKLSSKEELKNAYKKFAKLIHPDNVGPHDKYIASEAFSMLGRLTAEGEKELDAGTYGIVDPVKLYQMNDPLFSLKIKGKNYDFYENVFEGEVAYIYRGVCEGEITYMKLAIDAGDNELLDTEFNILTNNKHQLLPYAEAKIKVNDSNALIMREIKGETLPDLLKRYPKGIPAEHVMWMLERLFNVVGWLHYNKIVHGNIKPENIIINKDIHMVTLLGFSFAIPEADKSDAKYKIVNDFFTAPEVNKDARVLPNSDIYSIGRLAVQMLGGSLTNNGMPVNIDARIRTFIRKLCDTNPSTRPGDAWQLWDELIKIRTEVYGKRRFLALD